MQKMTRGGCRFIQGDSRDAFEMGEALARAGRGVPTHETIVYVTFEKIREAPRSGVAQVADAEHSRAT